MFDFLSGPEVEEIEPEELHEKISADENILILDIRSSSEYGDERIEPDSGNVKNFSSRKLIKDIPPEILQETDDREIVVVCNKGNASRSVAAKLDKELENSVMSLKKGMSGWRSL